jgi:hypothetical protein
MKIVVEFDNLSEAQAVSLEEMFAVWMFLKDKQMSMWTSFFADCAIDFKPVIKVNGEDPKRFMKNIGLRVGKVKFVTDTGDIEDDMYLLDYERVEKAINEDSTEG